MTQIETLKERAIDMLLLFTAASLEYEHHERLQVLGKRQTRLLIDARELLEAASEQLGFVARELARALPPEATSPQTIMEIAKREGIVK